MVLCIKISPCKQGRGANYHSNHGLTNPEGHGNKGHGNRHLNQRVTGDRHLPQNWVNVPVPMTLRCRCEVVTVGPKG